MVNICWNFSNPLYGPLQAYHESNHVQSCDGVVVGVEVEVSDDGDDEGNTDSNGNGEIQLEMIIIGLLPAALGSPANCLNSNKC